MIAYSYWNTIFVTHKLGDMNSDISFPNFPDPIMGDVIFHNMHLLKDGWKINGKV
jgi:hypothetical protein